MKIDLTKKYRTRGGYEVVGLREHYPEGSIRRNNAYRYIGTVLERSGEPMSEETWTDEGKYMRFAYEPNEFDLVEVTEEEGVEELPTLQTKQQKSRVLLDD